MAETSISIIYDLVNIRLRKLITRKDKTAIGLICMAYGLICYLLYANWKEIGFLTYFLFLDNLIYHATRKDINLLKVFKHYKMILFAEYTFYTLPLLLLLLLKKQYLPLLFILVVTYGCIVFMPKIRTKRIQYPFYSIDPFWRIYFRKYYLALVVAFLLFVHYMGIRVANSNLQIFCLLMASLLSCLPSFDRENSIEINYSPYAPKQYLNRLIKANLLNSLYLFIPFIGLSLILVKDPSILLWAVLAMLLVGYNVILKYAYFQSPLKQQLYFTFTFLAMGLPLLCVPILYKRAIKNLNHIKKC